MSYNGGVVLAESGKKIKSLFSLLALCFVTDGCS